MQVGTPLSRDFACITFNSSLEHQTSRRCMFIREQLTRGHGGPGGTRVNANGGCSSSSNLRTIFASIEQVRQAEIRFYTLLLSPSDLRCPRIHVTAIRSRSKISYNTFSEEVSARSRILLRFKAYWKNRVLVHRVLVY